MTSESMAQRWDFLSPWCWALQGQVTYGYLDEKAGVWDTQKCTLQVVLPRMSLLNNLELFQIKFQKMREALALLAAVERVDYSAWRFLLETKCDVDLGNEGEQEHEEKIPVRFLLILDLEGRQIPDGIDYDLVRFCGSHQRTACSAEYLDALKRIAEHDRNLKPDRPGLDIQIPVRVYLDMAGSVKRWQVLEDVSKAHEVIARQWECVEDTAVPSGALRCTFVLEPMVANFLDFCIDAGDAEVMENLVKLGDNWFSRIEALSLGGLDDLRDDDCATKMTFCRLMGLLFGLGSSSGRMASPSSLQHPDSVELWVYSGLPMLHFEALCSSLLCASSAPTLAVGLLSDSDDPYVSVPWWQWLAYSLFSSRVRSGSSFDDFRLSMVRMSEEDMEGFCAVLTAEHPEEYLCGTPRGQIEERTARLTRGAAVRWHFNVDGQLVIESPTLTMPWSSDYVVTFSDDGSSEWVDAIVPGFGRCQVRREDLIFDENNGADACTPGLISLTIEFSSFDDSVSDGLPQFIEAVGPFLKALTIEDATIELDVNEIIRCCPELQILSLGGGTVDMQIDLSGYRANNLPVPIFNCYWPSPGAFTRELSDMNNALTNCVRRLRVRVTGRWEGWVISGGAREEGVALNMMLLRRLLKRNAVLEFLELEARAEFDHYMEGIRKYHLKPVNRSLKVPLELKAAFLSALAQESPTRGSKKSCPGLFLTETALAKLDRLVLMNIFAFAAPPVLREVYFRCMNGFWGRV